MIMNFRIDSFAKTAFLCLGVASLALTACGDKSATATTGSADGRTSYETATDHGMGSIDAPITVVEYASVTCGHCANWATTVWPTFKSKFIDSGQVRYVFREFPTQPVNLARAGHLLANCAPEDKYFDLIHVMFKRQRGIFFSDNVREEFVRLAKSAGMSEAELDQCMANEDIIVKLQAVERDGFDAGVSGTPTFFVNGKKHASLFKIEDFEKVFAETLGKPLPKTDKADKPADAGH